MATVQDIFNRIAPRLGATPPVDTFVNVVATVVYHIDKRLLANRSNIIKQEFSLSFAADTESVLVPENLIGANKTVMATKDSDGSKRVLDLVSDDERWRFSETGSPRYYDFIGDYLYLYPTPNSAFTVKFMGFGRTIITAMTDNIPYNGRFDNVIAELSLLFGASPITAAVDQTIQAMVTKEVDILTTRRSDKGIGFYFDL